MAKTESPYLKADVVLCPPLGSNSTLIKGKRKRKVPPCSEGRDGPRATDAAVLLRFSETELRGNCLGFCYISSSGSHLHKAFNICFTTQMAVKLQGLKPWTHLTAEEDPT